MRMCIWRFLFCCNRGRKVRPASNIADLIESLVKSFSWCVHLIEQQIIQRSEFEPTRVGILPVVRRHMRIHMHMHMAALGGSSLAIALAIESIGDNKQLCQTACEFDAGLGSAPTGFQPRPVQAFTCQRPDSHTDSRGLNGTSWEPKREMKKT